MLKKTVVDHFKGTANVARALGITYVAVAKWGAVVPLISAMEVERITGGALKVDHAMYRRGRPIRDLAAAV